ncbi:putative toxin-antitoxin system toxin component, PIN family [Aetokthonos hydrillicola Thurmond2011]|uniref:Toxin-antitoxin system toxin component, PIN family n=1 Tax=Aetokthonos hydrillicola Thurmond2011 TaxID=2712845 RepID=A0AAP5MAZ1_9CYAN|nr:putative toxin-antitoxin system toxin component, PIN family [Aetokthonos hydrillicola]MBO3462501.1 putative toxin-antitoxin system toxin component, PIN family [Aetokthonos hydrillicola CCALA 1050]MBW4587480.1 putative toxin-antitoxin system toxin component, PIN family [Aetokthonos hydrillicola CCALA 1050]MDR9898655.1 putative toxin-antitoxin system toxin component, PIN family [Aetokthonos hydrillicola Thurmond2011]
MLRVVFDTNVLISRLLAPKESLPAQAVRLVMEGANADLFSEATFRELGDVLSRAKFDPYLSREKRLYFLSEIRALSEFVTIHRTLSVCRDPRDDKFLDLVVCGNADYLVTGDEDLLNLHPFEGVSILSPASFLARQ